MLQTRTIPRPFPLGHPRQHRPHLHQERQVPPSRDPHPFGLRDKPRRHALQPARSVPVRAQRPRQRPEELLGGDKDVAAELIIFLQPPELPGKAREQVESAVAVQLDVSVEQQQRGEGEAAIPEGQTVMH